MIDISQNKTVKNFGGYVFHDNYDIRKLPFHYMHFKQAGIDNLVRYCVPGYGGIAKSHGLFIHAEISDDKDRLLREITTDTNKLFKELFDVFDYNYARNADRAMPAIFAAVFKTDMDAFQALLDKLTNPPPHLLTF